MTINVKMLQWINTKEHNLHLAALVHCVRIVKLSKSPVCWSGFSKRAQRFSFFLVFQVLSYHASATEEESQELQVTAVNWLYSFYLSVRKDSFHQICALSQRQQEDVLQDFHVCSKSAVVSNVEPLGHVTAECFCHFYYSQNILQSYILVCFCWTKQRAVIDHPVWPEEGVLCLTRSYYPLDLHSLFE